MTDIRRTIHNIFVWSYDRGTLQYDILCALILAFIFLVPPSCFVSRNSISAHSTNLNAKITTQNANSSTDR